MTYFDTTTGQFSATAQNLLGTRTFTIAPASTRNASMGVCKARLVGDFTYVITGAGGSTNKGYFFMGRIPEPPQ
jgi:hypothetical protein